MFDHFSLLIVILDDTLAGTCIEDMNSDLTPVFKRYTLVLIPHANLLVHFFRTPVVPTMRDQLLNDASDSVFTLPFDLGVDEVGFLRILGDVWREETIIVVAEAILSVGE